jgi:hypothetical protein
MNQIISDSKSISKLLDMLIFFNKHNLLKFKELDFELENPMNIEKVDGFLITPWGKIGFYDPQNDGPEVVEYLDSSTVAITQDFYIEIENALYVVSFEGTVSNNRFEDPPELRQVHSIYKVGGKNESIKIDRLAL